MIRMSLSLMLSLMMAHTAVAQEVDQTAPRPVVTEVIMPQAGIRQSWVGSVAAREETDLGFLQLGTLASRAVDTGAIVTKGQVLAMQDPRDLDADLRAAQAGVTVAEAQAQSARDAADRASELVARGVASATTAQDQTAQLAAAEAQLEQARAALARAQDARDNAVLIAPQDGVITQVFAEPGATLTAGAPVLRLAGTTDREVVIDMTDDDLIGYDTGAVFDVTLEADRSQTVAVTLTSIDPVASQATRTRRLRLALPAAAPVGFRLGALVSATPQTQATSRTSLPAVALIGDSAPPQVWRVNPGDRSVRRVPVEVGPGIGDRVPVTGGLSEGDEIVVRGVNSLEDGQIVGPRVQQ